MSMIRTLRCAITGGLLLITALPALAQATVSGGILTDPKGLTLYVFDNDATVPGGSACVGGCLNMWTPLKAPANAQAKGDFALVTRDDGTKQWAYKGKPLYRWYNDKKPGDKDGDGLRGAWHVAKP